jgi:UDP-glucuronate 4-epimerase
VAIRALVTGGAGFIGSHLVEGLLADGHSVTVLDNFDPFYPPEIKRRTVERLAALASPATLKVVEGDIRSAWDVRRAMEAGEPDAVVHLAALAGVRPSCERPAEYAEVNVAGSTVVLEAARRAGIRRFVFASSSSVYGETSAVPFREDDTCGAPISPYAATKRAGELLCSTYVHLYGMRIICPRFFTAYGPRQRPDLAIHKFTRAIAAGKPIPLFGDGATRRDYTYVSDITSGARSALDWTGAAGAAFEVVNLGGSRTTTLIDLVRHLERLLARSALIEWQPPQPGDVPITYADIRHAQELLGYEPRVSLEDGLARFVEWFEQELGSELEVTT